MPIKENYWLNLLIFVAIDIAGMSVYRACKVLKVDKRNLMRKYERFHIVHPDIIKKYKK